MSTSGNQCSFDQWRVGLGSLPHSRSDLLYLVFSSLGINVLSLALPIIFMQIYDRILPSQAVQTLTWLMVGFFAALVLETVLRFARFTITNWLSSRFEHCMGSMALNHLLHADIRQFEKHGVSVHADRLSAVTQLRQFYSGQTLQLMLDMPFSFIFIYVIWYLAGWVAFFALGAIAIFLLACLFVSFGYRRSLADRDATLDKRYNFVVEALSGVHTLKSLTIEEQMLRRYERLQADNAMANLRLAMLDHTPYNLGSFFSQVMLFSILIAGGMRILDGELTLGALGACVLLGNRTFQPFQTAAAQWLRFIDIEAAKSKINKIGQMDVQQEDADVVPLAERDFAGRVTFEDVSYREDEDSPWVLENASLIIEPGVCVGFYHDAASRYTSLFSLVSGIVQPTHGRILLDDEDMAGAGLATAGGRVAFLPQYGTLFNGTIIDNIASFDPDKLEAAYDAAALMELDTVVADLTDGYETVVGNRMHETLSSGIVQRISIARALVTRPRVLLIDNTTLSMDKESEEVFLEFLQRFKGMGTIILASEVPSLLELADTYYTIDQGNFTPVRRLEV